MVMQRTGVTRGLSCSQKHIHTRIHGLSPLGVRGQVAGKRGVRVTWWRMPTGTDLPDAHR